MSSFRFKKFKPKHYNIIKDKAIVEWKAKHSYTEQFVNFLICDCCFKFYKFLPTIKLF